MTLSRRTRLTTEVGLAAEMGQDPDNHDIITRYVTNWHEG